MLSFFITGTGPNGITGDVFVVSSFDDLKANADKAKGKIVVFDAPFVNYGETVWCACCRNCCGNITRCVLVTR
jgi:hypothetical protein